MGIDIISLYEDLRKYMDNELYDLYDDMFYGAPEGDVQIGIVSDMLKMLIDRVNGLL